MVCHTDTPGLGPLTQHDLLAEERARVWYADVIMFFSMILDPASEEEQLFAWVQWYEPFGGPRDGSDRRHVDPDFPSWIENFFPRVYLQEQTRKTGASYEIIRASDIIGPAPITDDLSLMHYSAEEEARARVLQPRAAESEGSSNQKQRLTKAERRRMKALMQKLPELNEPLIPTKFQCPRQRCTRKDCSLLHPEQFKGGDVDKTHLRVVNLLVFEFSRGVWHPPWSQVRVVHIILSYHVTYGMTYGMT